MILAGDIGGTKVNLALFERRGDGLERVREDRFSTARHAGLTAVVREFLERGGETVEQACFGVAGPVLGETIELTNAGWKVDRTALRAAIGVDHVEFLNDLEATAYGIDALAPDQLTTLVAGEERGPTRALIAAGTGLGMAIATGAGESGRVLSSEGGHADFAPRGADQVALFEWLHERFGHVSIERVVSGPGIHATYRFLVETGRAAEPAWLTERLAESEDPSAAISDAALAGDAPAAEAAMDLFVACYAAAAGNLVLTAMALGGLYVGGGIAPRILPLLERDSAFARAFRDKGRLEEILAEVPVRVILEPRTALLGAARRALLAPDR